MHSAPSGQTWSVEGGGFCGGDYTVYNNTVDNLLYAMNCNTGVNTVSASTDLGATVNTLTTNAAHGLKINIRSGYFAVVTAIILSTGTACFPEGVPVDCGGFMLDGAGPGGQVGSANATMLVAKTAAMTMLESTSAPSFSTGHAVFGDTVSNMMFLANNKASIGINFGMQEVGGSENHFRNLLFTETSIEQSGCVGGFSTAMILDGNEDAWIDNVAIAGDGQTGANHCSPALGVQWKVTNGNVNIIDSFSAAQIDLLTQAQTVSVMGSTIAAIKFSGLVEVASFTNNYMANAEPSGGARFALNGQTVETLYCQGNFMELGAAVSNFFAGTGTVSNFMVSGNNWLFSGAGLTWNAGGATLSNQLSSGAVPPSTAATSPGSNHIHSGSAPTGFPWTVTAGNF